MNAAELETKLQSLRAKAQESERKRAEAIARRDAVSDHREQLLAKFNSLGFSTPQEAEARLEEIASSVEKSLAEIEAKVS